MEMYYENQVDLAMVGREGFVHKENRKSTDKDDPYSPESLDLEKERPDLQGGMRILSAGEKAEKFLRQNSSDSRYIDIETLRVTKEFEEGNTVENLEDIERRYNKHVETFYAEDVEEAERLKEEKEAERRYDHVDEIMEF